MRPTTLAHRFRVLSNALSPAHGRSGLLTRLRRYHDEADGGVSRTVLLFHPPAVTRAELQEACMRAVGERSARIVTPGDGEGGSKDHSYVLLSSPEVAASFVERGVEFDGITHVVKPNREMHGADRIGVTTTVHINFPESLSVQEVVDEAGRAAGAAVESFHVPANNPNLVYVSFGSPADAIRLMEEGVVVNGEELRCDYSNPRRDDLTPKGGTAPAGAWSYEGDTWTVCVRHLSHELSDVLVKNMVQDACGKIPVRVNSASQGEQKLFFIEMQTPQQARDLESAGLVDPDTGVRAEIRFQEERRLNDEFYDKVYGKTTRVLVGAFEHANQGDEIIELVRSAGFSPTDVEATERNVRFTLESPEAAVQLYEQGLVIRDQALRVRLIQPDISEPSSEVRLANLPFEVTEEEVSDAIESALGLRPQSVTLLMNASSGKPRGLGFARFLSTEDGRALVERSERIKLHDRELIAKYTRPKGNASRPRSAPRASATGDGRGLAQSVLVTDTQDTEAVKAAMIDQINVTPDSVSVENGNVRVDFATPESATDAVHQGLELNGSRAVVVFRRSVLNSELAGTTSALYISRLEFPLDTEALMEEVAAQTGIRPSFCSAPADKNFLFLNFSSPSDAATVAEAGFSFEGRRALIGYSVARKERRERRQRYD